MVAIGTSHFKLALVTRATKGSDRLSVKVSSSGSKSPVCTDLVVITLTETVNHDAAGD